MRLRERPSGSGIHGRPVLDDRKIHIARYREGAWWTWCGQRVPDDHLCPDRPAEDPLIGNCYDCYQAWSPTVVEPSRRESSVITLTVTWTSARVRALRTEMGLSQSALAARIGVGQGTVSDWETGRMVVRTRRVKAALNSALGEVPADVRARILEAAAPSE